MTIPDISMQDFHQELRTATNLTNANSKSDALSETTKALDEKNKDMATPAPSEIKTVEKKTISDETEFKQTNEVRKLVETDLSGLSLDEQPKSPSKESEIYLLSRRRYRHRQLLKQMKEWINNNYNQQKSTKTETSKITLLLCQ
ncbi:hypothetical protein G6F68_019720 [Rhizopus microsporus]|nr:hypothetical protein G6F68_019720 [Rhizopus microsporus]